jgi:hypothetical protein
MVPKATVVSEVIFCGSVIQQWHWFTLLEYTNNGAATLCCWKFDSQIFAGLQGVLSCSCSVNPKITINYVIIIIIIIIISAKRRRCFLPKCDSYFGSVNSLQLASFQDSLCLCVAMFPASWRLHPLPAPHGHAPTLNSTTRGCQCRIKTPPTAWTQILRRHIFLSLQNYCVTLHFKFDITVQGFEVITWCKAVCTCRKIPKFRSNKLSPSSGQTLLPRLSKSSLLYISLYCFSPWNNFNIYYLRIV